jgi:hypothetical protein
MVANSLHLQYDELAVLRDLQAGTRTLDVDDLMWAELAECGLVERRGVRFPFWSLTMRGRLYKTD